MELCKAEDCTGCMACGNVCPAGAVVFNPDAEGFMRPEIDAGKCVECGKCRRVCPVLSPPGMKNALPEKSVFAAWNRDEKIRMESSSGGVFTCLAEEVLSNGGAVFGAAFDGGFRLRHIAVDNEEQLARLRGSKYVQSEIGGSFRLAEEFLNAGRAVLFSGTPCQIAGLRNFLGKEYSRLLCVDLVCHGVPSPGIWRQYLRAVLEREGISKIEEVNFRDKTAAGWKRYHLCIGGRTNESASKKISESLYDNPFMKTFLKNLCLRPSCYACPARGAKRRSGDITLGDFWGIQNRLPEFDDDRGCSLLVVNTPAGDAALKRIGGKVKLIPIEYGCAAVCNPSLEADPVFPRNRARFWRRLAAGEKILAVVRKETRDPLKVKLKSAVRCVLKKLGLLETVKKMLGLPRMVCL